MMGTRDIPGDMLSVPLEDVAVWWHEDRDSSSTWFLSRFVKALISKIVFNCLSKYFVTFAVVHANSIRAYGSPIQAREVALSNNGLHQLYRREESGRYSSLRIIIPVTLGVCLALFIALYINSKKKDTRPRVRVARGLRESMQAGLAQLNNISRTNNRRQSQNASGTGRTERPQREYSTHSLPPYAKEPGESEQVILHTVEIPPADRRIDSIDEEGGTSAENVQESQPPSESMPTNPSENITADSSSSIPPEHYHRPSGNDTAMRVEAVDNHDSATPGLQREAPPPYVEAAGPQAGARRLA